MKKLIFLLLLFLISTLIKVNPVFAACSINNPGSTSNTQSFNVTVQASTNGTYNQLLITDSKGKTSLLDSTDPSFNLSFNVGPLPADSYKFAFVRFDSKTNNKILESCVSSSPTVVSAPILTRQFYCHSPNTNTASCNETSASAASGPYGDETTCNQSCPKTYPNNAVPSCPNGETFNNGCCKCPGGDTRCVSDINNRVCTNDQPICPSGYTWNTTNKSCDSTGASESLWNWSNIITTCQGVEGIDTAIGCIPTGGDLSPFLGFLLRWALGVSGGIILLMLIATGYGLLTSSGNPEKLQAVKENLVSIFSGLILIGFSLVLLQTIGAGILKLPTF